MEISANMGKLSNKSNDMKIIDNAKNRYFAQIRYFLFKYNQIRPLTSETKTNNSLRRFLL